jgi:hypothetical protein
MGQEPLLAARANIEMPNESHILDLLDAHYGHQRSGLLVAPELNVLVYLTTKFLARHVWFRPAISRDDPFVSLSAIVDGDPNRLKVVATGAHHGVGVS